MCVLLSLRIEVPGSTGRSQGEDNAKPEGSEKPEQNDAGAAKACAPASTESPATTAPTPTQPATLVKASPANANPAQTVPVKSGGEAVAKLAKSASHAATPP